MRTKRSTKYAEYVSPAEEVSEESTRARPRRREEGDTVRAVICAWKGRWWGDAKDEGGEASSLPITEED